MSSYLEVLSWIHSITILTFDSRTMIEKITTYSVPKLTPDTYLGVIPWIHLFAHRCNKFSEEIEPVFLIVDLLHVDISGRDVLVATVKPFILRNEVQIFNVLNHLEKENLLAGDMNAVRKCTCFIKSKIKSLLLLFFFLFFFFFFPKNLLIFALPSHAIILGKLVGMLMQTCHKPTCTIIIDEHWNNVYSVLTAWGYLSK